MMFTTLRWSAALCLLAGAAPFIHAQVITDGNTDRGLRYPGTPNADGEPYTQRYAYGTGGIFYLNGSAREMWNLDYRDRLERAQKFGYRKPIDPSYDPHPLHREWEPIEVAPPPPPAPVEQPYSGRIFGWWRRH